MPSKGSDHEPNAPGLLGSAKGLVTGVIAALETRLQILGTEIQEERIRLTRLLLWGTAGLFCIFQGITLLALFTVLLFWESNRLAVLGLFCGLFLGAGVVIGVGIAVSARAHKAPPLSNTLEVLAKDRERLEGRE